ncbi:GDSL esterase/lipase [Acorus calamus]|uniref:GDSL esterase/lipase n=1 Tax=Acorus calamus TaxID=4465 RepID=A0AAV9C7P6_ACOCL|nr:GDSL esterase/lipase [Acorus calamus]
MANLSLPLILLTCLASMAALISKGEAARAFFVFGDSLVDNGNNDFLFTTARADAYPYGIDTPSHLPTGRFSNGKNIPDIITRRVLVTGTGPLGCVPAELALRSRDGNCDVELQRAAGLFNPQLVQILNELNQEAGAEVFVSANAFDMHMDYITNPQEYVH